MGVPRLRRSQSRRGFDGADRGGLRQKGEAVMGWAALALYVLGALQVCAEVAEFGEDNIPWVSVALQAALWPFAAGVSVWRWMRGGR